MKTAFLFPGQGSQTIGMAQSITASSAAARDVMAELTKALGPELASIMKEGPEDSLKLTRNAQPALMAAALCVVRALEERTGKPLSQLGAAVAGHSLGEYAALASVQALDIGTTAKLLQLRGDAMQAAVPVGQGAMAALLGASIDQAQDILGARDWTDLDIANDNAPGQVVLSGRADDIDEALELAKAQGIKKAIKLPVSAPFHCRLMAPAKEAMAEALSEIKLAPPSLPIYCNVTGDVESDPDQLRKNLVEQVTDMVRWRQTLIKMQDDGITQYVELGTGKVLTGLVKRTLPEAIAFNIETAEDLDSALEKGMINV